MTVAELIADLSLAFDHTQTVFIRLDEKLYPVHYIVVEPLEDGEAEFITRIEAGA